MRSRDSVPGAALPLVFPGLPRLALDEHKADCRQHRHGKLEEYRVAAGKVEPRGPQQPAVRPAGPSGKDWADAEFHPSGAKRLPTARTIAAKANPAAAWARPFMPPRLRRRAKTHNASISGTAPT